MMVYSESAVEEFKLRMRELPSHIPDELNLRTFELGMISYRPDPAAIPGSIAVYADSVAPHCQPWSCSGRCQARLHQRPRR